jgi:hypothetical protein
MPGSQVFLYGANGERCRADEKRSERAAEI